MQGGTKENKSYYFDYAGNQMSCQKDLLTINTKHIMKYINCQRFNNNLENGENDISQSK